jgi:DNA-binding transcriptional ArsR family regulator
MINKNISSLSVSEKQHYKAYKLFFSTLNSEPRLRVLNLLRKTKMNVSEIQKATGFEQSVVSHNLMRLLHCGFIIQEIKGKYRYYKINKKTIKQILNLIDEHMSKNCLKIIKRLKGG